MPPGYVKTIRDELLYEYAKLISRSALEKVSDPFVSDQFKKLRGGSISISGTMREWERERELPKECVYCGSTSGLTTDHLIPKNKGGDDSADNVVLACASCNSSKSDKGVFEWLGLKEKDALHRLVAGKYLKQLLSLHEKAGTLDMDKSRLLELCKKCRLSKTCQEWDKEHELTCLCLESIINTGQINGI